MKRFRRMMSLNDILKKSVENEQALTFKAAMLMQAKEELFGNHIASHIARIECERRKIHLYVDGKRWKEELTSLRSLLAKKMNDYLNDEALNFVFIHIDS